MIDVEKFDRAFDIAKELYDNGKVIAYEHDTEVVFCFTTIVMGELLRVLKNRNKCSEEQLRILGSSFVSSFEFSLEGYKKTGNENFLVMGMRTFQDQAQYIMNTYDLSPETC